jgi:mono/diheme cytochrome c family protein
MKKKVRRIVYALVPAFLGILLAGAQISAGSESGKKIFDDQCAMCHGQDGKGNGPAAGYLSTKMVDFTDPKYWQSTSDKKMEETIRGGRKPMPAFDLTSDQMKAVIEYMKQAFRK